MNSILTYCKTSKAGFPKILFVATHKDQIPKVSHGQLNQNEVSIDKLKRIGNISVLTINLVCHLNG